MSACIQCGEENNTDICISCDSLVCRQHAGYLKNYVSLDGKKGRGCNACISEGLARPDYGMTDMHLVVPDAVRRLEHKLYPRIINDINALTEQTKQEAFSEVRLLVRELEETIQRAGEKLTSDLEVSAGRIVNDSIEQARFTLRELTGEITNAISSQRIEVKSDAEKIVQQAGLLVLVALRKILLILMMSFGCLALCFAVALKIF